MAICVVQCRKAIDWDDDDFGYPNKVHWVCSVVVQEAAIGRDHQHLPKWMR